VDLHLRKPTDIRPHRDNGFFGPGSVTWKVWSYPTSVVLGFLRSVVIEELDPFLVASVAHSGQVKQRTQLRYDRTMQYFATVKFGDAQSVLKAAETLAKIHGRSVGPEPVTGGQFDANDPDSQLWIHLTAWHSILYTYEVFGPGKLSAAREAQYWRECAIAAHFQTIDPATVPLTRDGVAAYFEAYRPRLVGSDVAKDMMNFLLDATSRFLDGVVPNLVAKPISAVIRRAVIATFPAWMRELSGLEQSRAVDLAVTAQVKVVVKALSLNRRLQLAVLAKFSPLTVPIVAPIMFEVPATDPKVWSPQEAYAHFAVPTPREQYAAMLAARATGHGPAPYDQHHHDPIVDFPG
jgi:uncharacterized protein (DUF2236 family)